MAVGNQPKRARSTRPPPPLLNSASIPTSSTGTPSTSNISRCRSVAPGTSRGEMIPLWLTTRCHGTVSSCRNLRARPTCREFLGRPINLAMWPCRQTWKRRKYRRWLLGHRGLSGRRRRRRCKRLPPRRWPSRLWVKVTIPHRRRIILLKFAYSPRHLLKTSARCVNEYYLNSLMNSNQCPFKAVQSK